MDKADNNTIPENIQRIVQEEQPDPDCKDGDCDDDDCDDNDCPEDINELPVPLPHFRGRRGPRRGPEPHPIPCPMPRYR